MFDTETVRNKNNKILSKVPNPLVVAQGVTKDGTVYAIPDTPDGYGDENSLAQLAEDYVGHKTGSDEEAKAAGELAREQYNTDVRQVVADIKRQQFYSKNPSAMQYVHRDNDGTVTGVTLLFALWNPATQKTEYIEQHFDAGSLLGHALLTGRQDLINQALG